jgi:hypothetical protein
VTAGVYTWVLEPSAFVDVPNDTYLITRTNYGLVARVSLNLHLPFHSEIVTELCAVLQDIEEDIADPGYPLLDGRSVDYTEGVSQ